MTSLCDFPPEVLYVILIFSKPKSIVIMRQCCTLLEKLTRDRALWMEVLRAVCRELSIHLAYLRPWNLSSSELEATACSNIRFTSLLFRHGKATDILEDDPTIEASQISSYSPAENIRWVRFQLLPGGRLLCAVSQEEIQLFDLRSGKEGVEFDLIARVEYNAPYGPSRVTMELDKSPRDDGTSAVFVVGSDAGSVTPVLSLFEIGSLNQSRATLTHLGTLPKSAFQVLAVHSGFPVLFNSDDGQGDESYVGLWDHRDGCAIQWKLPYYIQTYGKGGSQSALFNGFVIIVSDDALIYSIPTLTEMGSLGETSIIDHHPLRVISFASLVSAPPGFLGPYITPIFLKPHRQKKSAGCELVWTPPDPASYSSSELRPSLIVQVEFWEDGQGPSIGIEASILSNNLCDYWLQDHPYERLTFGNVCLAGGDWIKDEKWPVTFFTATFGSSQPTLRTSRSCFLDLQEVMTSDMSTDRISGRVVRELENELLLIEYQ